MLLQAVISLYFPSFDKSIMTLQDVCAGELETVVVVRTSSSATARSNILVSAKWEGTC